MKSLNILLLEDDPRDAELTQAKLSEAALNLKVVRVDRRESYLAQLNETRFDIILADYSLPSFDGVSALEIARAQQPDIPFIFVSGVIGEEKAIETLRLGATDYVLKHRLERLVPSVERALREAGERNERRKAESALRLLAEASNVLSASLDYHSTLTNIVRIAVPFFATYCVVDVLADDGGLQRVAVEHADPEKQDLARALMYYPPRRDSLHPILQVLRSGESLLMEEIPDVVKSSNSQSDQHHEIYQQLGGTSLMIVPLCVQNRVLGTVSFVRDSKAEPYSADDLKLAEDLTQRAALAVENARLYREAQEANRTKDEFLATISHELRTPLMAMLGWTNMLRKGNLDADTTAKALETIERNARAQAKLISDILDVSRIISGKLQLEIATLDLNQVIQAALEAVYHAAQAKNIGLEFSPNPEIDTVMGDADRLQQVVWNLVSNAIKFTPTDGIVCVELLQDESQIQIRVRDNGQGIEPEFLPYVFDRFRQADGTSTRKHGGLGLGLAIVRHLVELHGGSVHALSDGLGKGATFVVNLLANTVPPTARKVVSGEPVAPLEAEISGPVPSLAGVHVLVVDDEPDSRDMITLALRRRGAQVTANASAKEALDSWQKLQPHLLISDIGMPGQSGYDLIQRIREIELSHGIVDGQQVPAIALSAYAHPEDRERSLARGFHLHATKPIEPEKIVRLAAEMLEERQAHLDKS